MNSPGDFVLGCAFLDEDAAAVVLTELSEDDFPDASLREVFSAMRRVRKADAALVWQAVDPSKVTLVQIAALSGEDGRLPPDVGLLDEYIGLLKQERARRAGRDEAETLAQVLTEVLPASDVPLKLANAAARFSTIAAEAVTEKPVTIGPVAAQIVRDMETASVGGGGVIGLRSGIDQIDAAMSGLALGDVITIAGRTSFGKSALALQIAAHVAEKARLSVLFFSCEMKARELGVRVLAAKSGLDAIAITQGTLNEQEREIVKTAAADLADVPLHFRDRAGVSLAYVHAQAAKLRQRDGLGLVVIDYLQRMAVTGRFSNRVEAVQHLSRGVKEIASALEVPILLLSQLSRAADQDDRPPRLSDLRESGSIEQDSDAVLFLHRKRDVPLDARAVEVALILAKNRRGPLSRWRMLFETATTRFTPIERGGAPYIGPSRIAPPREEWER